jgi:hypothetical protein
MIEEIQKKIHEKYPDSIFAFEYKNDDEFWRVFYRIFNRNTPERYETYVIVNMISGEMIELPEGVSKKIVKFILNSLW